MGGISQISKVKLMRRKRKNECCATHFRLDSIITVAQVLQVGGCIGLNGGEVVLQHVDHLRQLRVTPRKLPGITGGGKSTGL